MAWCLIPLMVFAAAVLTAALPSVALAWEPGLTWQTLDTPHFRIHFHDDGEALARRAASKMEVIHEVMTAEIGWQPKRRTDIVLVDPTDSANGYATTIPNNTIVIYLTAPMDGSALDFYEDWLTAILVHEYTHILHIDTISGLPGVLRKVFGRLIMSNDIFPRWVVEGYAVHQETLNTLGGRARSTYADMVLRMATLEEKPIPLGNAEGFQRRWPGGNIRYLWGGHFMTWVAQTYGWDQWSAFMHRHSRALNPLAYDWHAYKVFGKSLYALWDEWQAHLAVMYAEQQAAVEAEGRVEGDVLIAAPGSVTTAAWDPTGSWIYFAQGSEREDSAIKRMPADGGEAETLLRRRTPRTLSFSPDGRTFYFASAAEWTLYTNYLDLWAFDTEDERLDRLTFGARLHDPAVSPDGHRMLGVVNHMAQNDLAWVLPGGQIERITHTDDFTQYGSPRWAPDGLSFAVSTWKEGGNRDIHIHDNTGQHLRQLSDDRWVDVDPSYSPDGRYLLFSSDRSGISNLYAYELATDDLFQITNVVGGAFDPQVSPDGQRILFRGYAARGYDLRVMPYNPSQWRPATFENDRDIQGDFPDPTLAGATLPGELPPETWGDARPYSPLPGLLPPRLLAPSLYFAESGYAVIGAFTYARDALSHHAYQLAADYRTDSSFISYSTSYSFTRFRPGFSAGLSTRAVLLGELLGYPLPEEPGTAFQGYYPRDYQYFEVRSRAWAGMSYPLRGDRSTWVQYNFECREPLTAVPGIDTAGWDAAPFDCPEPLESLPAGYFEGGVPDRGSFSGLTFGWRHHRARGYAYSISPEDGQSLTLTGRILNPYLGSDYDRQVFTVDWRGYRSVGIVERLGLHNHAVAWRLAAGAALGDPLRQKTFRLGGSFGTSSFVSVPSEFYPLRGYGVGSDIGDRLVMGSAEYRLPLFYLDRGLGSLPLFLRGASLTLFTDVGQAFDPIGLGGSLLDPDAWAYILSGLRAGSGAEVNAQTIIGYGMGFNVRLGYALGWNGGYPGDLRSVYLQLGSSF